MRRSGAPRTPALRHKLRAKLSPLHGFPIARLFVKQVENVIYSVTKRLPVLVLLLVEKT